MPHRANFAKLQTYLLNLSKINFNEADAEFFIEAILKYIDVVINISADKGHRDQIKICRQWLDILQVSEYLYYSVQS